MDTSLADQRALGTKSMPSNGESPTLWYSVPFILSEHIRL